MATQSLENLGQGIHQWFNKVQKQFQKRSGWRVDSTLSQFSQLGGAEKVWFGGLLLGQAILGGEASRARTKKPTRTRTSRPRKRKRH